MVTLAANVPQTADEIAGQTEARDSSHSHYEPREINVGIGERKLSLLGGGGLILLGLKRKSVGGLAIAAIGTELLRRGVTGRSVLYHAIHRNTADQPPRPQEYFERGIHVESAVTINRPANELFRFWRDFANLPRFMRHLKTVQVLDEKHSRWVAKAPARLSIQWDAEIINEEPDSLIAWRSVGGTEVDNAGSVRFVPAPEGRGTEVRVVIDYLPPAGKVGSIIARIFGEEPHWQIKDDLRRFKNITEAGEIPTTQGQPQGTCRGSGKRHHGM
jgi:uncharacterized membrane protein